MQTKNVPATGPRYWTLISVASVFGANMGDFVSHDLHLGHIRGVPFLVAILAVIFAMEAWSKVRTDIYYWLAIITMRTMATNLADLATHDFKLPDAPVLGGLTVLLAGLAVANQQRTKIASAGVPRTDAWYWAGMLAAGTLGTALGDGVADHLDLGVGLGSIVTSAVVAVLLGARSLPRFAIAATYWACIVAIRTAGTNLGDFSAHTFGLSMSTMGTGLLFALVLLVWRETAVEPARVVPAREVA